MKLEQPQAFRTVFFDAGLTLLYAEPSIAEVCLQVCQRLGLQADMTQILAQVEVAEDFFFQQAHKNRHTWADEKAIAHYWISYYMEILRPFLVEPDEPFLYKLAVSINAEFDKHTSWQLYPDVIETITALHERQYTLGIISDWGISLAPILRHLGLIPYFDCLIISAATRSAKPSPHLYETALQRANAIPDYTIHIGDSYINDVIGARTVGITPILLDRAYRFAARNVDCLLAHSLTDILDILEVKQFEREHQIT